MGRVSPRVCVRDWKTCPNRRTTTGRQQKLTSDLVCKGLAITGQGGTAQALMCMAGRVRGKIRCAWSETCGKVRTDRE